jgi:hypothetical protein
LLYGDLPAITLDRIGVALQKQQIETLDVVPERANACGLRVTSTCRAQASAALQIVRAAARDWRGPDRSLHARQGRARHPIAGSIVQRGAHLSGLPVLLVK